MAADQTLLKISDLSVQFPTRRGVVEAARKINLQVQPGEVLGLVGESGAGTVAAYWRATYGNYSQVVTCF